MTRPKIRMLAAAFAPVPGWGKESAAMLSMVEALRADLDLVTVKTEDLAHIKRIGEARMFRVPVGAASPAARRDAYTRALARQIQAEPYEIVHALDPWAGQVAARSKHRGYTVVYEIASFAEQGSAEEALWQDAHRESLEAADTVLVSSVAAADALEAQGVTARIEVLRPSVDLGAFDWADLGRRRTPRLLYLGTFAAQRDLDTVLAAVARVAALRPIEVLFAGERDADARAEMRARVDVLGLNDIVEVRGEPALHTMSSIICGADVCIAPASGHLVSGLAELPSPLLEHLACGRPLITADVPGVSELVRDEIESLLYPPGDASALADATLEVLRDAVLRERMTEAGYRRARDELSSGARRRRVRALYEGLAPGTQLVDPWRDHFEEVTGLIELSTAALERLKAEDDTGETAEARGREELTRPRAPRPTQEEAPPSQDTHPGLVLPDTDPGRS
jgi:glycosyltransferase involved in cell wall biosynthesis